MCDDPVSVENVLAQMHAADVFASPSTREASCPPSTHEGFGITYAEAMAAGCTGIGADHPESAAGEVIGDAGFLVDPTVDDLADTLEDTLGGQSPRPDPTDRARRYDWDAVARQAEDAYVRAVEDRW